MQPTLGRGDAQRDGMVYGSKVPLCISPPLHSRPMVVGHQEFLFCFVRGSSASRAIYWLRPNNCQYQRGYVANSEMHQDHGRKRNCHADMRSIPTRPPTLHSTIHCSRQPASVCGCKPSLPSQQPCAGNHWHLPIPVA